VRIGTTITTIFSRVALVRRRQRFFYTAQSFQTKGVHICVCMNNAKNVFPPVVCGDFFFIYNTFFPPYVCTLHYKKLMIDTPVHICIHFYIFRPGVCLYFLNIKNGICTLHICIHFYIFRPGVCLCFLTIKNGISTFCENVRITMDTKM